MSPQRRGSRWLSFALRATVAVALLGFLFSRIPVGRVADAIASVRGAPLVAALLLTLFLQLLLAQRLVLVAREQRIWLSLGRALAINLGALFYGLFLPGGNVARVAVRAYNLARAPSGDVVAAAAVLLFDRFIATAALGVVGLGFWLAERPEATIGIGAAFLATSALPLLLFATAMKGSPRSDPAQPFSGAGKLGFLERARESLRRFRAMPIRTLLLVLAASVVVHLLTALLFLALAMALGMQVSLVTMGWVSTTTTLLTMLPITPSGLGVREGTLVFLLGRYGVSGASAIGLSFLVFAVSVLLVGALGGLLEAREWVRRSVRP